MKSMGSNDLNTASSELSKLKASLLNFDSLPPMDIGTPNALEERTFARQVLEAALFLSIKMEDRDAFARSVSSLKPYYIDNKLATSPNHNIVIGLNLLYLLVEDKTPEFHSELELLTETQMSDPNVAFCTQLDQHLNVGSYDLIINAASNPPHEAYRFFLDSLMDTVRINIGDCASAAYSKLSLTAAKNLLMFSSEQETLSFIQEEYPEWKLENNEFDLRTAKGSKSQEINSQKLISQTLQYAIELERIV